MVEASFTYDLSTDTLTDNVVAARRRKPDSVSCRISFGLGEGLGPSLVDPMWWGDPSPLSTGGFGQAHVVCARLGIEVLEGIPQGGTGHGSGVAIQKLDQPGQVLLARPP